MNKVLIICGPTATGKTDLALSIAKQYNGELLSADSRQVYKGMDVITGKDLPPMSKPQDSNLKWHDRALQYYIIQGIKVWLYDIVDPDEEFNVSFWRECAQLVIADSLSRNKLPIIVGGTGLYIKSLTNNLQSMVVPPNLLLRNKLAKLSVLELFEYLKIINLAKANNLNTSDRKNPRRLVRAIEIAEAQPVNTPTSIPKYDFLLIGLKLADDKLFRNIDANVAKRIEQGAREEFDLMRQKYDLKLPSMTASGYASWNDWALREKQYARRQLTWFKKQPNINWLTKDEAPKVIKNWYN